MVHVFRFFLPVGQPVAIEQTVTLASEDARRLHKVLRLGAGESVEVADGRGAVFGAEVIDPKTGTLHVTSELPEQASLAPIRVLIAQSGPRADHAVEKLVELGVGEIGPLLASSRRREARTDRWERIAASAAAQAKLAMIPRILEPVAFLTALQDPATILCSHQQDNTALADAVARSGRPITLLIGPEAGFSSDELAAARAADVPIVRFGSTVLRTETAAIVAAAVVREWLSESAELRAGEVVTVRGTGMLGQRRNDGRVDV